MQQRKSLLCVVAYIFLEAIFVIRNVFVELFSVRLYACISPDFAPCVSTNDVKNTSIIVLLKK